LERFVGETFMAEVVPGGHADLAAQRQVFTFVALRDDVDDAAGGASAIEGSCLRHHLNAFNLVGIDA